MELPVSNSILSVVDEIRLEFSLVANEAKS
jgi:hypothetical protein